MSDDLSLPSLPMDLPELALPGTSSSTAGVRRPKAVDELHPIASPGPAMIVVDAAHLVIDDRFGMDVAALADRYAKLIAEARDLLSAGAPQTAYPFVLRRDDGRYSAFTELPVAMAAIDMAGTVPTSNVMLTVILRETVDGEALLASMFERQQSKSLYEKACYITGCETKYRSRRAWMRAESISPEKWEPRFSKIAKIGKLDRRVLARIDPHTITNADSAGRIVDAWADPDQRRFIMEMVDVAAAEGPANAGPLFKRIDVALGGNQPVLVPGSWVDGTRELHDASGILVAKIKRAGNEWSIAGSGLDVLTRAAITSAFAALKD